MTRVWQLRQRVEAVAAGGAGGRTIFYVPPFLVAASAVNHNVIALWYNKSNMTTFLLHIHLAQDLHHDRVH